MKKSIKKNPPRHHGEGGGFNYFGKKNKNITRLFDPQAGADLLGKLNILL